MELITTFLVAQTVKRLPTVQETWVLSLGWEDPLEKEMATHSSILAWKIPWMEERGRLQSMGSQIVGCDWATSLTFITKTIQVIFMRLSGFYYYQSVQLLSLIWLFATPWTTTCQASLSITISWSLLKLMSVESMIWSNHLILCPPRLLLPFPASGSFPVSQFFASGGQRIGISASASVLPVNIQDWFPLGFTGWISLLSKGLSRVFSNTTVQKHQFFSAQLYVYQCFMYSCLPYKLFSYMFICLSHIQSKAYLIICIL